LDAACFRCLEDVVVQRRARSGVINQLVAVTASPAAADAIQARVTENAEDVVDYSPVYARGLALPVGIEDAMIVTATWGHGDLIFQARERGVAWDARVICAAARGGHLRLLQRLRQAGCPWDDDVVPFACTYGYEQVAIWALENGAPVHPTWLNIAATHGRLHVLQWAFAHGRLLQGRVERLSFFAGVNNRHVVDWLRTLRFDEPSAARA
jgi:hypothetical protein